MLHCPNMPVCMRNANDPDCVSITFFFRSPLSTYYKYHCPSFSACRKRYLWSTVFHNLANRFLHVVINNLPMRTQLLITGSGLSVTLGIRWSSVHWTIVNHVSRIYNKFANLQGRREGEKLRQSSQAPGCPIGL